MLNRFLYGFIFLLLFSSTVYSDMLKDIKKSGVLKAGVKHDFEPFGFVDQYGEVVGFDIDLLNYIANDLGVKLQTTRVTSKNRIEKLEDGFVDMVAASMTHKRDRDIPIDFSISYFFDGQSTLTRSNIMNKKARGFSGKKVGAIEGSTSGKNFKRLVPKARIVYFDSYDQSLESLKNGEIDAMTTDLVWCALQAKKSNGKLKVVGKILTFEPYGIGVRENESNFRDAVNNAIQKSVKDGTYLKLYKKWFDKEPKRLPEIWPN